MVLLPFVGEARHMLQAMPQSGITQTARFPAPSVIHPSAWKADSANFACTEFSEVRTLLALVLYSGGQKTLPQVRSSTRLPTIPLTIASTLYRFSHYDVRLHRALTARRTRCSRAFAGRGRDFSPSRDEDRGLPSARRAETCRFPGRVLPFLWTPLALYPPRSRSGRRCRRSGVRFRRGRRLALPGRRQNFSRIPSLPATCRCSPPQEWRRSCTWRWLPAKPRTSPRARA